MSRTLNSLEYTGKEPDKPYIDNFGQQIPPYYPSNELVEAVNLAIYLQRPLLLKGEPGCGKTRLAQAVALELDLPYETWYIQSTSRAKDGLYMFDTVGRLRDAQLANVGIEASKDIHDAKTYRRFGPLGKALDNKKKRTVVLIDEIDKADIDFPNDLLRVLDELSFYISETGEIIEVAPQNAPIIFITSNDERRLPAAFLRRCLFHYIEFPDQERLQKIVHGHFPDPREELLDAAITRFQTLRQEMRADKGESEKKVSTSELLDWVNVLHRFRNDNILQQLRDNKVPYASVLLKSWPDHQRYLQEKAARKENLFSTEPNDDLPDWLT